MGIKIKNWGLILFWCCCLSQMAHGQVIENFNPKISIQKKHDLNHVFDHASVTLDLETFSKSAFEFQVAGQSAVFLGGRLWFYAERDTVFKISTSALKEKSPHKRPELKIFKENIQKKDLSVYKGVFHELPNITSEEPAVRTGLRDKDPLRDFFFVAFIIVLMLLALFKGIYPVIFTSFARPASVFSTDEFTEHNVLGKVFSSDVLLQVLLFSLLVSLLLMTGAYYGGGMLTDYLISSELNELFFIWLLGSFIFMVLSLLKYFWIKD